MNNTKNFEYFFNKNDDHLNTISSNAFETIRKDYSLGSFISQEIREFKEITI